MTTTATARSRTQKERRAATRQLLLDTTLECLAQFGYARTTTQLICERSGLTRGAPQHYFSTHEGLLAEAIDHLRQRLTSTYERVIASMPEGPCHAQEALDVLWDLYTGELFRCALELWVGARTNPALAEQLAPVERDLDRITMRICRDLFPELAPVAAFDQVIVLILSSIRGLALLEIVQPSGTGKDRWPQMRAELLRTIDYHTPTTRS